MNVLRRQNGVTLVETLLAAAILVIVVTTTLSVLLVAEASGRAMVTDVDTSQQLRAAMRQITDDLTYASSARDVPCDPTSPSKPFSGNKFEVMGHMPQVPAQGPGDGWPGALLNPSWEDFPYSCIVIRYELVGDMLIRESSQHVDPVMIYARQVLATGLMPYQGQTGSYFSASTGADGNQLVTIVLRMRRPGTTGGAGGVDEVSTKFFLP